MTRAAYGWRSHYTLVLLLFVYTMSFIDRQIMGILMQPIKQEFQVSDSAMGMLGGLTFALFYSVLAIPFGRYADRTNRRNFVAYCCGAWSVMTAVCGMVTGFWTLALARIGVAIGEAGGTAPSLSMVADHYPPQQRGRAMGVYWLGPQLGILFGLTLGGWIAQHHGWRAAFIWMAIPGVIAAVLLRFIGVEPSRGRWEASGDSSAPAESLISVMRDLHASKAFVRITLAGLMMGFAGYGIGIWTPAFLVRSHGMSLQGAGAVMGLLGGVAAAMGALLSGWLCDRLAKRDRRWRVGVPLLGCVLSVPSGLAFYLMPAGEAWHVGSMVVPHAIGFYVLFGLTAVWWTAPVYTVLAEVVAPQRRATTVAFFNLGMTMVGGGLGPLLVGLLSDGLASAFGVESLRYALALTTGSCYALGVVFFYMAMQAYERERIAKVV
ncbi:MAG: MFS transporter [Burkholderiales bacterium]